MSSESLFASLQRRVPLLAHPRQHAAPLALAGAAGLTLGAVGLLLFGLPVWAAAALALALLAFPLALKWRADQQRWGAPLTLLGMLLVIQGLRTAEHLAQWAQYHLLGWPLAKAGGLVAPLNPEVVQFVWAWAVLLLAAGLLRTRGRNLWMWLLLAWTALQTAELSYTFAHYLQTGVQQMPGILGRGGWLAGQADSLAPAAWLTEALPQLVATPRLDVQFWWSIGALLLLLPAAHTAASRLLSSEAPAAQAGIRPALAALRERAAAPLGLLRRANRRLGRAGLTTAALVLAVVLSSLLQGLTPAFAAPGTVSGLVYQDYNGSGTQDQANELGVAGITVTAYDATGAAVATATTAANGTYTLNVPVAGDPLRVEFTNLPPGYQPGPMGTGSGSKVQFVTATVANVNLGVLRPADYCQNNPQLASECYFFGAGSSRAVVRRFPYQSGTTSQSSNANIDLPAATTMATQIDVGATWGLAYARTTRQLYTAAFMKRHMAFGPGGPGAIYRINRDTNATTLLVDLNSVFPGNPAGTDLHTPTNRPANAAEPQYFDDESAWNAVGKAGYIGLDLSDDEQFLWTVTLADTNRRLYRIPVTGPSAANIQSFALPDPGTGATGCPAHPATQAGELNRNLRPGAVVVRGNLVYVGLTCTAESTQLRTDLRAFVYAFDTTSSTYTQVVNFPLTYPRGAATTDNSQTINLATWEPWVSGPNPPFPIGFNTVTTIPKYFSNFSQHYYPQPWLSDIAFDERGAMIVALMDRFGQQSGNRNGAADSGPIEGVSAGDVLRLAPSGATWTLENNAIAAGGPTGGAGNNQGPGGGEFYFHDRFPLTNPATHNEITLGGLALRPGSGEVVATAFDPPPVGGTAGPGANAYRTGGLIWLSNSTGQRNRSYMLYSFDQAGTFGKAAGIGDVELLCDAAPIEIGNRVWEDADRDGVQDPGEPVRAGVTVQLYDATGTTLIATTTTDANGNYLFKTVTDANGVQSIVLPNTGYQIRIPGLTTSGYALTLRDADATANGDERDSDASLSGTNAFINITTGGPGTTNHSYDFGVYRSFSLGNRVWNDLNNNGLDDDGAGTGIDGVTVNLYADTNGSGTLDAGDTAAGTATTAGGGYYLFTGLPAGNYLVQLPGSNFGAGAPLESFVSSTGTQGSATGPYEAAPDPDNNIDRDDNGSTNSGGLTGAGLTGGIVSLPVTLGPINTEPTGEGATPGITDPTPDDQSNVTLDFGVFRPAGLGDFVWNDLDHDGVQDAGEPGFNNVTVRLYDSTGTTLIATTTTNAAGGYSFTNLLPNTNYVVRLDNPANYAAGGPLASFRPTLPNVGGDDTVDSDATLPTPGNPIGAGNFPTIPATTGAGGSYTPTFDVGFFQPLSLGNRIWNDLNNNGLDDDGAGTGIGGVTVNLLDAGGAVVATTTTNAQGYYLFTDLLPGTYTVELAAANFTGAGALAGFTSSTGKWGNIPPFPYEPPTAESTNDGNDNGRVTGTLGAGGSIRSNPITLAAGTQPTGEPATPGIPDLAADANGNLTVDFGVYRPASLGDFVWNDLDHDGVQDTGEAGIPGVTVNLYDATGTTLIGSVVTDASGTYSFTNLQPGTNYVVRLDNPANYTGTGPLVGFLPTLPNVGGDDAVDSDTTLPTPGNPIGAGNFPTIPATTGAAGSNNPTFDAGFWQPLSLGNRVWNDLNNNGLDDDGAGTGIGGVTVNLLDAGGAVVATTTTTAQGYYLFTGLAPGTYSVELAAANFTGAGALVGFTSSTGKWGNIPPFPYEPGAGGTADADDNGSVTGTLGAGGSIRSGPLALALGTQPTGEPATPGITDPAADTNSNLTIDFGVVRPAGLGDFIWNDLDHDGVQDAGEPGFAGVTVNLYDATGTTLIGTTTTNATGGYSFTNLQPGTNYVIRLDNPTNYAPGGPLAGYGLTVPNTGGDDTLDSDATLPTPGNPIGAGNFPTIPATTGAGGSYTPTFDAGFWASLSLGNRVWNDLNNNGLDDGGETGVAGVTVNLLDAGGAVIATTTTNAQGYYLFTDLLPGTYTVELAAANFTGAGALVGFTSSTGTWGNIPPFPYEPGAGGTTDADDNGSVTGTLGAGGSIRSGPITLTAGGAPTGEPATPGIIDPAADNNSNVTIDFGVIQPASLGDFIWNDLDRDGVQDAGEAGIPGVTVNLYDATGTTLIGTIVTDANGNYTFPNLQPGTNYVIRLDNPADYTGTGPLVGFLPTLPNVGGNDATDSDATLPTPGNPIGAGNFPTIPATTGGAGSNTPTFDAGFWQPLSLGNRVWNDLNNNGLDDGGETGVAGVTVNLLDAGGAVVATTTTNAQGYYLFTGLAPGTYTVELPASNFTGAGALVGFTSSSGTVGSTAGPFEPAPNTPADANDNGTLTGAAIRSGPITLALGTAPTGEPPTPGITDPAADTNSNLTVDFGVFQPLSLGNQVWNDQNNNGLVDGGETGVAGVTVELRDAGTGTLIATTTTNAQGYYLFTNLGAGSYVVVLPAANFTGAGPLVGFASSTGATGSPTGPYEPGNSGPADNNDNGTLAGGAISSAPITLTAGTAPTGEPATPSITDPALDINSDRTIDFGVFQPLSLGNRVWNDLNNNGLDDDGAGTGIGGVTVNLLDAGGAVVATTTTTAQGYYLFTGLLPGTYTVELAAANFTGAGALVGFTSSTGKWGNIPPFPYEPGAGGTADADDNGTLAGGGIRSGPITLALGTAPTGEPATPGITDPAADNNSNLTVDFGVVRPASLGDFVWNDLDRDGVQDAGEAGIPGVTVNLYDATGTVLIGTVVTDANGNYTFPNLQPGTNYVIRLDNPADYTGTGPLVGFLPTLPNTGGDDTVDSDATLPTPGNPIGAGNFPTIPATTGAGGSNTPTFDAGFFQPLSLGNRVWNDLNNNGLDDDGAGTGIGGVTVNLLDAGGAVVATTTTNAQGYYLFTGLGAGTYTVELPASNFTGAGALVGFASSTGKWGNIPPFPYEPGAGGTTDADDNGTLAGGGIRSGPIALAAGGAPTGEPATPGITDPALDTNSDRTIDFGVFRPASLGDFIWNDLDRDGVQDAGEAGIPGVTVNLYDTSGTLVATVVTDASGNYSFPNLQPGTNYVIRLDNPADYTGTGPLVGFLPTLPNAGGDDTTDSDATLPTPGNPIGAGNFPTIPATTGGAGSNTPTFDAGFFQPLSLGNRVWNDLNNNGLDDGGETGVAGVTVNLLDAGGAVVATTTTNAQGYYLFTGLAPGTYTVELPASNFTGAGALVGFTSSSGTNGSTAGPFEPAPNTPADANDNGTLTGAAIRSGPITLALGTAPTGEPPTPGITDPAADTNSNLTVDFGVFQPLSLGNQVWNDLNNNGLVDGGETGVAGVTVELRDAGTGTLIAATTTNAQGYYLFTNLNTSSYVVVLPAANFTGAGPLVGFASSTGATGAPTGPYEPGNSGPADNNDNGTLSGGAISSTPITLTPGTAPTGEPATPGITDPALDTNSDRTIDFGVFQPLSLGNRVWNDLNNNGLDDDGAGTGIGGVTVNLLDAGGAVVATTTTTAQGYYLFTGLPPGTYTVELPASNFTGAGALVGFTSSTGTWGNIPPFPYEPPAAESTNDGNDNGTLAGGGIRSNPITLALGGAPTGEPATPGITDPAADNNSNLTVDFGVYRPASLGDFVWNDLDRDGVQDAGEAGIPGVTVNLYDATGTVLIGTVVTDANGNYTFPNLQPGTNYVIRLDNPADYTGTGPLAGFLPTLPNTGGDDTVDSDATLPTPGNPIGAGNFPTIPATTGAAGTNTPTFDAGFFQPLSLGNRIWNDLNNNGLDDGGETGVAGVTVNLLDAGGAVIATTTTNAQGYYLFTDLASGTYTVELPTSNFTGAGALVGFTSSTGKWGNIPPFPYEPGAGGTTDADDNGTLAGGGIRSGPITLTAGGAPTGEPATPGITNPSSDANSDLTVDFGVFQPASIGDRIWNDINHNGVQDAGEVGIPGVTVNLYDTSGNLIATVITDANGNYTFPNLQPGASYEIRLDNGADYTGTGPLAGFQPTLPNVGGDDGTDSDATLPTPGTPVGAGNFPTIPVVVGGAGSNTPTFDAGLWQPLSLGNQVWNDLNNNGLIDGGETGVAGVTVNLLDAGGAVIATTTTNAQGYYLFSNLLPGTYTVELPTSNFTGAGALVGYNSSTGTAASVTGPYEPGDNGANDNNDNGTLAGGAVRSGAIVLTLGTAPTGEPATPGLADFASDPNSNQTIDFGVFQPLSLGNQVWHDQNNNGVVDGGETGVAGVTVNLLDAGGTLIATTTTNAQGYFLFTNLGAGSYVVELPAANFTGAGALVGYSSSSGSVGSQTGPYEPGNSGANDNNDNGSLSGGGVRSDVIVLTPGGSPTGEAPVAGLPDPASDTNSNQTIDFGVFQPLSLGNRVWVDTDNNGLIDGGESAVANVAMQLLDAGGAVIATTQTNAQGYYLFTNLLPGTYSVRIAPSNFAVGGPLVDYISSTGNGGGSGATNPGPYEPGSGGGVDDNDNGTGSADLATSGITSAPITLALGGTPTGEPATPGLTDPAADANSDITIDFGVFLNPTAIGLVSFTAVRDGSDVKLSWTTSVEVDTAGFYLYRSADRTRANAVRITPSLLAARGNGGGATYSWTDTAPLETGYYWLQEVEVEGGTQDYGPVAVQQPGGSRILLPIIRR